MRSWAGRGVDGVALGPGGPRRGWRPPSPTRMSVSARAAAGDGEDPEPEEAVDGAVALPAGCVRPAGGETASAPASAMTARAAWPRRPRPFPPWRRVGPPNGPPNGPPAGPRLTCAAPAPPAARPRLPRAAR